MKHRIYLLAAFTACSLFSCNHQSQETSAISISPEAGSSYKSGTPVAIRVSYPAGLHPDSVVYLIDSVRLTARKDSAPVRFPTDTLSLGPRVITARVYHNGRNDEVSTNVVLVAPGPAEAYTYRVEKVYPHDTSAYTEGLQYAGGYLYESTGNYGQSSIRKVDLASGKVLQETRLDKKYFGEGFAIVGDRIVQLTYREKTGLVYDRKTLRQTGSFSYTVGQEGWGMCYDGSKLYADDSSNRIWLLDRNNYHPIGFIDVYDDKGPVDAVNELEFVDGKLYANVYTQDTILRINPKTGAVEQKIDMANLWPLKDRPAGYDNTQNVLNGIAWDEKGKRLFVTGKKWPHVYQVKFVRK